MTRKLLFILFPLFLLIFVSVANAQTATDAASKLKLQKTELRQQIKDVVAAKKLETKTIVATKREEFKTKLQTIRDEKKKALVERIDTKLSNINSKHTDRFTQVLSNLQILLDNISPNADTAIAQAAIDSAKTAVENQAAKTYAITISSENTLRLDVGTITSQLREDLVVAHKLVIAAKQKVQTLRKNNALMKKDATSSANL